MIGKAESKVGHFDDAPAVLEFVNSKRLDGTGGTRHVLPRPFPAHQDPPAGARLRPATSTRRSAACRRRSPPIAPTTPPITNAASMPTARRCATRTRWSIWCPRVGMITFARDKATARIAGEFYRNAINVMRGASIGRYLCRPARAGSLRHRILAARRGQAPAHAEAEEPRRPHRAGHRRRRRHRPGDRRAAARAKARRGDRRHRQAGAARRRAKRSPAAIGKDNVARRGDGRHRRGGGDRGLRRDRRSNMAGSTSWSPTPASRRRRRSRTPRSRCGTATWTSSPRAISWWRARRSGC